jgi:hypothetical protein
MPAAITRALSATLLACCTNFVFLTPAAARATEFYVALNGNDANPGAKAKPFASLEAARDAIRSRRASQSAVKERFTVWKTGFKKIPVEQIGLRDVEPRRALKRLKAAS